MSRVVIGIGLLVFSLAAIAVASDDQDAKNQAIAKNANLERVKKLAGEWHATDEKGQPTTQVVSVFKVISAGNVVHETIFPGTAHEMVSVYHLDGADLLMTHYCAAGNQPRMKADPKSPPNQLRFNFAGGFNLNPEKDMHMHEGWIGFIDDNTIEWAWVGYENGKAADKHKVVMKLVRKK